MIEINEQSKLQHNQLKQKISLSLEKLNKSTFVFDEIITDYNYLYKKFINLQYNALKKEQEVIKIQNNDNEDYKLLKEDYFKLKEDYEKKLLEIKDNLETIMKLKEQIEKKDRKITGLQAENSALKGQNIQLDTKNKELNEINVENEKKIFQLNKLYQRMEINQNKLIEDSVQIHQDFEELQNKMFEMQTKNLKNNFDYQNLKSEYPSKNILDNIDINEININLTNTEGKFPDKLKYKQIIHNKGITSISFNEKGNKYITTGEDNSVILLDASKNSEISKFSKFKKTVSEACFNKNNNLILAGSYDATVKLLSSQNLNLISNFTENTKQINCVKSYHNYDKGLAGSSDYTIKEFDLETKKIIEEFSYESGCFSLNISLNDNFILSGHDNGMINMWTGHMDKRAKLFKLHENKIIDLKIVTDNTFLSLSKDKKIKLFDIRAEKEIYTINDDKINDICESNIALSPDKNYFSVGSNEGVVYIIKINNGEIKHKINNNNGNGEVKSICWNNFNHHIYIGDSKGFVSIWGA